MVGRDRLDVRRVAGEARAGRPPRVVRVLVDGDDLRAGADREQVLGHGRRERDDPAGSGVLGVRALVRGRREGDGGERRRESHDESEGTTEHESSFREGFELRGGRQVF